MVRDKDGNPKVDDPATLHPIQIMMLTVAEREALGLWAGAYGIGGNGLNRLTKISDGVYKSEDDAQTINEVYDNEIYARLPLRVTVPIGGKFNLEGEKIWD